MERLTKRIDGWVMRKGCHGICRACTGAECADLYPMIDRLADYEDTGLTPEEVKALVPTPNDPLTLEELREMDGEPVWGADGQCYIVNVKAGYAVDKDRGFRMLWSDGFFYRRRPEEVDTCQKTSSRSG